MAESFKVLVIDDESATLTMFRLFLVAYGHEVLLAEHGRTGIELVRRHRPQIVFTDLKMPEIDGLEVLKEIKKIDPRTEVIVITGHGDMDLAIQALNLDATDFINKPIMRSALDAALRRAAERLRHPLPDLCEVAFSEKDGLCRIHIKGTLRRENRDALLQCCQKACSAKCDCILLHFMDNSAVNGGGISELINCLSTIHRSAKAVAVVGLSENFRVIFQMVGIGRFAELFDTEAQAIAAISQG